VTSAIAQIESAFVARLNALQRPGGLKVNVDSYAGQLDDELFGWIRSLPAAWVTFDAVTEARRVGGRTFKYTGTFEVLSAQRHLGQDVRRLNDDSKALDIGVYELVEQNKLALVNQKLGLAIQPVTPGVIRSVMKGVFDRQAITVLSQAFTTTWMETVPEDAVSPDGELQLVGLNYLLVPGDDTVDSTDLVTTRTS
jgi:phage gp37-like protein